MRKREGTALSSAAPSHNADSPKECSSRAHSKKFPAGAKSSFCQQRCPRSRDESRRGELTAIGSVIAGVVRAIGAVRRRDAYAGSRGAVRCGSAPVGSSSCGSMLYLRVSWWMARRTIEWCGNNPARPSSPSDRAREQRVEGRFGRTNASRRPRRHCTEECASLGAPIA